MNFYVALMYSEHDWSKVLDCAPATPAGLAACRDAIHLQMDAEARLDQVDPDEYRNTMEVVGPGYRDRDLGITYAVFQTSPVG